MIPDPNLSYYGHPVLPAGYNSAPNDGDEVDGPGYNWIVSPVLFDTFEPLQMLIITEDMLDVFDGCADYVIACENTVMVVPLTVREVVVR